MVKKSYWSQPLALPPKHPRVRVYRAESGVEQLGRADSNIPAPNMTTGSGRTGDDAKYRSRSSWSNPIRRVSGKTDELPTSRVCRSEEHTSELQSLMRTSFAVFCLK